ncbi:MAG: hypothetical protein ABL930_09015 [Pseudobdellovibrio sp.]
MKNLLNLIWVLLVAPPAIAFPEMVRHHYVNCSACHVSNSGGGLLNAYGRTISSEVLSTWGSEKEARAFYAIDPEKVSEWLNVGGDARGIQLHQDNAKSTSGRFIWMEANLQAAVTVKKVTGYASVGQVKQANQSLETNFTKYYLSYQQSDELSFRLGRYVPIYGLNIPQHNFLVRQNLGLTPGSERDSADVQWNGESWGILAGVSKSRLDSAVRAEEAAMNLQLQYNLNDQYKIGINYWYGEADTYSKIMMGAQAALGWSENFYTLVQMDHVWKKDNTKDIETKSIFQLLKLGYEFHKGMHLQVVEEWGKTDTTSSSETQIFGVGGIWYPRPHFEFETLWSKRRTLAQTDLFEDYAYLMFHFYF